MKFVAASLVAAARISLTSAFAPINVSRASMASVSADGIATSRADYSILNNAVDEQYPGTAVARMHAARARARAATLTGEWEDVRRLVLAAGGLRDLPTARPGAGYTGHSFNDFNHCDLTCMLGSVASNENQGQVNKNSHAFYILDGLILVCKTRVLFIFVNRWMVSPWATSWARGLAWPRCQSLGLAAAGRLASLAVIRCF
jgi:hypothetical protein